MQIFKKLQGKIKWKQFRITIIVVCIAFLLGLKIGQFFYNKTETRQEFLLGTFVQIKLLGTDKIKLKSVADKITTEIKDCESKFSLNVKDSEVNKINNETGHFVKISHTTYDILENALYFAKITNGAFDPTIGVATKLWQIGTDKERIPTASEIAQAKKFIGYNNIKLKHDNKDYYAKLPHGFSLDLGAIAKGYITDRIRHLIPQDIDAILDLGGNICVIGNKTRKIGLQKPWAPRGKIFKKIAVKNTCIVTSGAYERYFKQDGHIYHHIIDPATGKPSESDLESVTIVTPNCTMADALSTALFVMGHEKAKQFVSQYSTQLGFETIFKSKNDR